MICLNRLGDCYNYLFYPAQFWPHKNHVTLLLAVQILREVHNLGLAEKVKKTGAKYFVVEQPAENITFSLANLLQSYLFLITQVRKVFFRGKIPKKNLNILASRVLRFITKKEIAIAVSAVSDRFILTKSRLNLLFP